MQRFKAHLGPMLAFTIIGLLAAGTAWAEKPDHAGGGKDKKHEQNDNDRHDGDDGDRNHHNDGSYREGYADGMRAHFDDQQRNAVRNYYSERIHSGHCPPGLAKKHNGCMPPGQARMWVIGQPLPREVIFYELPPEIIVHLGTPPPMHRFVRVASDILLIAVGTGMVVDAIDDLSNL